MANTYKYKYESPTKWGLGYEEVKISKKEFKEIFGKEQRIWNKVVVFTRMTENGRKWYAEIYASKLLIVMSLLFYPVDVLMEGLSNIKSVNKTYSDLFNQREKGTFYTMNGKTKNQKVHVK